MKLKSSAWYLTELHEEKNTSTCSEGCVRWASKVRAGMGCAWGGHVVGMGWARPRDRQPLAGPRGRTAASRRQRRRCAVSYPILCLSVCLSVGPERRSGSSRVCGAARCLGRLPQEAGAAGAAGAVEPGQPAPGGRGSALCVCVTTAKTALWHCQDGALSMRPRVLSSSLLMEAPPGICTCTCACACTCTCTCACA